MSTPELSRVYRPIVLIFRAFGLWPAENGGIVYKVYGIVLLAIFSFLLTATQVIELVAFTELDQITKTMYMTLAQLSLLLKIVNFYIQQCAMQQLLDTTLKFRLNSFAEVKLFSERMRFIYKIVMALIISCNIAHFSAELKAVMTPEMLLPFPCWYPESWFDGGFRYLLAYSHQSVGAVVTSNLNGAMEAYAASYVYMIGVQMEILGIRLRCVGTNDVESMESNRTSRKREHVEQIRHCIQIHQQILKYTKEIESTFSPAILILVSVSGMVICSLVNEMARTSEFSHISEAASMLASMCLLILMPCYFGSVIIARSNALTTCVYESNWRCLGSKEQKLIIIFMERLKRTTILTVGQLFPINLQTFSAIMNFAYRLLALVKNFE